MTRPYGIWLATAKLADEPDIGTGSDPREAVGSALKRRERRTRRT